MDNVSQDTMGSINTVGYPLLVAGSIVIIVVGIWAMLNGYTIPMAYQVIALIFGIIGVLYVSVPTVIDPSDPLKNSMIYFSQLPGLALMVGFIFSVVFISIGAVHNNLLPSIDVSLSIGSILWLLPHFTVMDHTSGGRRKRLRR
jgi:hypothetical protein